MAALTSDLLSVGEIRYQPTAERIRALVGRRTVVDSTRACLVWSPGAVVPVWAFPEADVDIPRLATEAVVRYDDSDLAGFVTVAWHAVDRWLEEDEDALGHPRDPFTRVDVRRTSHLVEVHLDGELLATSTRARLLFETGLPVRHYLPAADVRTELFVPSAMRTMCAYKGEATYRSIRLGDDVHEDLVWTYAFPLHDAEQVRDLWCFYDEKVDVTVDGERVERPASPFA